MTDMYDLAIAGGGPAGAAAAVYAARKRLKTALIVPEWGGQSIVSVEIYNWIGTPRISGAELAENLKKHVEAQAGDTLDIRFPVKATNLADAGDALSIALSDGTTASAKRLLVVTGSSRRKLGVPGAAEFEQKGLTYCASCDGPLFAGKDVAVVGGGNAAFETALQLLAYCQSVTIINRTETFRADEITVEAARKHANFKTIVNAEIIAVEGARFVTGLRYRDTKTGAEQSLSVEGVFVEIGHIPNTEWLGGLVALDKVGQIITDPKTQRASHPRIWSAGDCTDGLYRQNNIAVGDAVKALEDIYVSLHRGS